MSSDVKQFHKLDIVNQFKELAKMLTTIENTVLEAPSKGMPGIPVRSVELMCQRLKVSSLGVEVLTYMIAQSPKIVMSECKQWLLKREVIIEAEAN